LTVKILLIDDHPLVLDGLSLALNEMIPDCQIKTAACAADALSVIENQTDFDWLFIDIMLPGEGGIELLQKIRTQMIPIPVVMMSGMDDASLIYESLQSGANGFIHKNMHSSFFKTCMSTIEKGQIYLSEDSRLLLDEYKFKHQPLVDNANDQLSDKQKKVLSLLIKGLSNNEIAASLGLTESTIKFHVSKIYSILNVDNRTRCVAEAQRLGFA